MKNRNILKLFKNFYQKIVKFILKVFNILKIVYSIIFNFIFKTLNFFKKLKNKTTNLFYISKAIIFSCIISIILLWIIFSFLPKTSWLNISAKPEDFKIYNFTGNGLIITDHINLNNGLLINDFDTIVIIGDIKYELKAGELKIVINKSESPNIESSNQGFDDVFNTYLIFNKNIKIEYSCSLHGNIMIEKENFISKKEEQICQKIEKNDLYSIYIDSGIDRNYFYVYDNTDLQIGSQYIDIYIKNKKIELPELLSLKFLSNSGKDLATTFNFYSNYVCYSYIDSNNSAYFRGKCESFEGKSSKEGTLKQTYLNKQHEYDISFLSVDSIGSDFFQLEYEYFNDKNVLQMSGNAKETNVSNNSINNSIYIFLLENQGEIIVGIFAAFITAYIPMILEHKKE